MSAGTNFDVHQVGFAGVQLVEASAGTGKTWNVSALYARAILEADLRVRQVLVVTFTKAAAAELRDRIRKRLVEVQAALTGASSASQVAAALVADARLRSGSDDLQLAARLRLALEEFDQAAIHTIHGFCQRALADTPFVAGVPLQSELVADDAELSVAVMRDTWRRHVQAHPLPPPLVASLLARRQGPEALSALLALHLAKPMARILWPEGCAEGEARLAAALPQAQACWQAAVDLWRAQREAILAQLNERAHGLHQGSYKPAQIERAALQWDELARLESAPAGAGNLDRLDLFSADRMVLTKAKEKAGAIAPDHAFFAAARDFVAACATLDAALRLARSGLRRRLLEQAPEELARRKREARVQTYDDLLTGLRDALRGARGADLADSLRARYPLVLVDEFQDTDPVQLDILERVWRHPGVALFLVGDPKQAIYAFRNADLYSYLAARDKVDACQTLDSNQRASGPLIRALNALFACSQRPFLLPGLAYQPVSQGAKPRTPLTGDGLPRAALQVWLLPRDAAGMPAQLADARRAALAGCADEIVRLLHEGRGGLQLGDRGLCAGDIAVLVRSHRDGREMRAELARRGVGSVELSQASVFSSLEAEDMVRVLAAVLAPADSGRVLAALATTLFGLDAAAIDEAGQDENLLARWMDEFAQAARRWSARGFAAMFWPLAARHGVVARLLASTDGARRVTNLRQLAELLHAAGARLATPEAVLAWLRDQVDAPDGEEERQLRLDSDAALVQIVTVHRAKGLEYPVVFCPLLWGSTRGKSAGAPGVREYHAADGTACIDHRDEEDLPPGEPARIRQAQAEEAFAEDLRLLYVALTRAANRCYLVAGAWRQRNAGLLCTSAARTALAWLVQPAPSPLPEWRARKLDADALEGQWTALASALADSGALAVDPLPPDQGRRWRHALADPATLHAAPAPVVPARRRVGSYSALVQARGEGTATGAGGAADGVAAVEAAGLSDPARDHDLLAQPPPAPSALPDALPALDILRFPRGTEAGTCLHAVLEGIDFATPARWPAQVERALAVHAPWLGSTAGGPAAARWPDMLLGWLRDLAAAPLPDGLQLCRLDARRCLHELEFHLPAASLSPAALRRVLARHGLGTPRLHFETLQGHLKGFIDLVVEHQGRWYVIDWKSNHLGDTAADYQADRLQAAVDSHDYALQALLYLLALHRLLQRRLAGYRPERHLGGALYLFVRGVRPGWQDAAGRPCGSWFLPAPLDALQALSAALDGGDGGAGGDGGDGGDGRKGGERGHAGQAA